jgi:hypothetical protein
VRCAACWRARLERLDGDRGDKVRVQRVLGHLLLNLGDDALRDAREGGYTYRAAENLLGWTAVE